MKTTILSAIACCLLCAACVPYKKGDLAKHPRVEKWYAKSIDKTVLAHEKAISHKLTPIRKDNPSLIWKTIEGEDYVLVSSWKKTIKYYKNDPETGFYNTGNYPIWVTLAPQLKDLCKEKQFGRREGLDFRLQQLLGLPPTADYQHFVEFWVRPQDLFRPCPDSAIDDNSCQINFPEDTPEPYEVWFNNNRIGSYYNNSLYASYPWTQLGYTYDWNPRNKKHFGLSEFIIDRNKQVIVKGISTTKEYCGR